MSGQDQYVLKTDRIGWTELHMVMAGWNVKHIASFKSRSDAESFVFAHDGVLAQVSA